MNWKSTTVISIGLVAATVAAYWPVTSCEFVNYDDIGYVYENANVLAGLSWAGWKYAWSSFVVSNWHPMTVLSLELDGTLWGANPIGYHLTNLAFHVANSVLLFWILQRITGHCYRSACVAALFALHPLHVESVAWVSERKDVLSTFFMLLTLWAYADYVTRPVALKYVVVTLLFVLGLLSKPMLVTLPILLMLLDFWPLDRVDWSRLPTSRFPRQSIRFLIIEKLPLLGLAFADGIVTIFAQRDAVVDIPKIGLVVRVTNAVNAYCWYLQKTLVPVNLCPFYPHAESRFSWLSIGFSFLIVSTISAWVYRRRADQPFLLFGWAWFAISLLPVIGLLQVGSQAYADRYAYIPHIGLFVMVVWETYSWIAGSDKGRIFGGVVLTLAIVASIVLTRFQTQHWKNSRTLWQHALDVDSTNGMAHLGLGSVLCLGGDYENAIRHIEQGVQLARTGHTTGYYTWGICLVKLDRFEEAKEKFYTALKYDSNHTFSRQQLAEVLVKLGRHAEAANVAKQLHESFSKQSTRDPNDYRTEIDLGMSQIQKGNVKQAVIHFQKAANLAPNSAAAHNNLASAQLDLRQLQEAKTNFLKALELNPILPGAHFNIATILEADGDLPGARHHFAQELRINPNDIEAKQNFDRLSK